jgi:hypothetical protein
MPEKLIGTGEMTYSAAKKFGQFSLTLRQGEAYISATARRPLTARLRASEAPHWNSESASDRSRMHGLRRLSGSPEGGDRYRPRAV